MSEDIARTQFWQRAMEDAAQFMLSMSDVTIEECGEPLVPIPSASVDSEASLMVAEENDAGRGPEVAYIRSGLLEPLLGVAAKLRSEGLLLRIEHSYRSPGMQVDLVLSPVLLDRVIDMVTAEATGRPQAEMVQHRARGLIANVYVNGTHISGSAVDTTVIDLATGEEVDRGGKYMALTEITPMDSPFVSEQARQNRELINDAFAQFGFVAYPFEFWHYSQGDAIERRVRDDDRPARYGPVTRNPDGSVVPLDPSAPVVPVSVLLDRIENRIAARYDE